MNILLVEIKLDFLQVLQVWYAFSKMLYDIVTDFERAKYYNDSILFCQFFTFDIQRNLDPDKSVHSVYIDSDSALEYFHQSAYSNLSRFQ